VADGDGMVMTPIMIIQCWWDYIGGTQRSMT